MKTLVLGSKDTVLSFGVVGVDGKIVTTSEEMIGELNKSVTSGEYSIVMVEESMALPIESKINEFRKGGITIVEIPSPFPPSEEKDFQVFLKKVFGITI